MFENEDEERSPQKVAEDRRSLNIGKALSDALDIKFDRVRKINFRSSGIIQMERTLHKKAWKILADLNLQEWAHEDTISLIWAGLLHEHPDIRENDVMAIWDATPLDDRMKAMADVVHALARAVGTPVDEMAYQKAMDDWGKLQATSKASTTSKE